MNAAMLTLDRLCGPCDCDGRCSINLKHTCPNFESTVKHSVRYPKKKSDMQNKTKVRSGPGNPLDGIVADKLLVSTFLRLDIHAVDWETGKLFSMQIARKQTKRLCRCSPAFSALHNLMCRPEIQRPVFLHVQVD